MMLFVSLCIVPLISFAQTNVALNKPYTLSPNSGEGSYADIGRKLTNGTYIVNDGDWLTIVGFYSVNPVVVVDLGSVMPVDKTELYFFFKAGGSAAEVQSCGFSYSSDGVNFTSLGTLAPVYMVSNYTFRIVRSFTSVNARYIRFDVTPGGNWTFLSEVMVYSPFIPTPTSTPVATPTPLILTPTSTPVATPTPLIPAPTSTPVILTSSTPTPQVTPVGSVTGSFGGVVYGRVIDKYRSPFSEIKVKYSTLGDEYLGKNPVLTDNDGYYYFEDVDTQYSYGLQMTAKRYGTITLSYDGGVQDSVVYVPDQMLIRGNSEKFTLSGTVKDFYSNPVEHARVRVKTSGDPHIVYTDSLGAFSVSNLFVGTYTVTAKCAGYWVGRVKYYNTDAIDGSVEILLREK